MPEPAIQEPIARGYYIKLGAGGKWAEESITRGLMRIGWSRVPLADIHRRDWESVREHIAEEHENKGTITNDTARLKDIALSTSEDVWITFHASRLWWCRLLDGEIEEDETSKFRRVAGAWKDRDTDGRLLLANQIPGHIAQLQGYRGTTCSVRSKDRLEHLINGVKSPAYQGIESARRNLVAEVEGAIRELHWKDFETLVDLIFRAAGWRRRSMLGESMKYADLELEEPITGDAYQVQIKSKADLPEFRQYERDFSGKGFRRLYFVVHSPSRRLLQVRADRTDVELILPDRLGELLVDAGLVGWLLGKVR